MSATMLFRPPCSTAFFAGAKTSNSTHQSSPLRSNILAIHPTPLLSLFSSGEISPPLASNTTKIGHTRRGSRFISSPLRSAGEPSGDLARAGGVHDFVVRLGELLSMGFPLWVSLACLIALWKPHSFLWVGRTWQIVGLTLTMLGMGMTLTLDDLRAALLMPRELAAGFVLQYTIMPLSGYFVSKFLKLPSYYAAGLILVGCCPGGTASNIVTFLARGNVALSVLMTAASTFAAAIMTPFLTSKLAGQFVAVDPSALFISTVQVVLAPVLLGAVLNQYCNNLVKFVSPAMPFIAVATVAILCGSAIAKLLGIDDTSARTISIEVGMQNSVLGVLLASQHFGNPLTAVPCAVSSFCHSVCGSAVAGVWRFMPVETKGED